MNTSGIRSRWAAVGAAVAVTLGAGGIGLVSATSPADATAYIPIEPCRVADTRAGEFNVGDKSSPLGPEETHVITAHGDNGECTGIPTSATGLQINVTSLNATAGTFLAVWGSGDQPNVSSLNPQPGQPPIPNAVTTGLTGAGEFNVFNKAGSVDIIVDIVGYYADHHHDDRYYTEAEVDAAVGAKANTADVDAALATKADAADVYTKSQSDGRFVNLGEVSVRQGLSAMQPYFSVPATLLYQGGGVEFSGNGQAVVSLDGPSQTDGRFYRLKNITYCIEKTGDRFVNGVTVWNDGGGDNVTDGTNRTAEGCYTVDIGEYYEGYGAVFNVAGSTGYVRVISVTTTWELTPLIFIPPIFPVLPLGDAPSLEMQAAGS